MGAMIRLVLLCVGYFLTYVAFSFSTKYFVSQGVPNMEFLFNSTVGSLIFVMPVVLIDWWPGRLKLKDLPKVLDLVPAEIFFLLLSGVCAGFVIPTTSLLYTFGFSVMVAMVIMRGSLIVISWFVDKILIAQGKSDKQILWQENVAVVLALASVFLIIIWGSMVKEGAFNFLQSWPFKITMALYIIPYGFRLYLLSSYKKYDSRGVFGVEQLGAVVTIVVISALAWLAWTMGWTDLPQVEEYVHGMYNPDYKVIVWSLSFGAAAFLSVFLFIYRYGSAVFNTALNRLTSLMAGTVATLLCHKYLGAKAVASYEWTALGIVVVAIFFLAWAAKDRQQLEEAKKS